MNSTWYNSSYNNRYENPIIYVAPTSFANPTDAHMHLGVMNYDSEYLRYIMPTLYDIESFQTPPLVSSVLGELVSPELQENVDNLNQVITTRLREENKRKIQNTTSAAFADMALRRLAQQETFAGNPDGENNQKLIRKRIMESIRKEQDNLGVPVIIQADGSGNSSFMIDEHGLPVMVSNPDANVIVI